MLPPKKVSSIGNTAHISEFLIDPASVVMNKHIARETSPKGSKELMSFFSTTPEEKEKFVWRMHQPNETRKYQLFPSKDKTMPTTGRDSPDPEQALAIAMGGQEKGNGASMRMRVKEQLSRRRKPSVTDLGLMTTVQETSMDSPTIPGRPPLHERSTSAPGFCGRRQASREESPLSRVREPTLEEVDESQHSINLKSKDATIALRRRSDSPIRPFFPRNLAPLVIPVMAGSRSQPVEASRESKDTRFSNPRSPPGPMVPPKSARMLDVSPSNRQILTPLTTGSNITSFTSDFSPAQSSATRTPWTPMSSNLSLPSSINIQAAVDSRLFPLSSSSTNSSSGSHVPTPISHTRGQSETTATSCQGSRSASSLSHRRGESEASIIDRGRPKRRVEPQLRHVPSKGTLEREQQAHEHLPAGVKASDVRSVFGNEEADAVRRQAIGQASRFEVLRAEDVEDLSRELRALDERCEYLRRTHNSLRAGRRNLHERICSYLRSPRVAVFSTDSILKQEEALKELDDSIDDWVSKLEAAENRQIRVRQKLLEHVCASVTIPEASSRGPGDVRHAAAESVKVERDVSPRKVIAAQLANNTKHIPNTPPRSPTRTQHSSPILASSPPRVVQAIQPSARESVRSSLGYGRPSAESIRIYVESDVYDLLADVEAEMEKMGSMRRKGMDTKREPVPVDQGVGEMLGRSVFVPFGAKKSGTSATAAMAGKAA